MNLIIKNKIISLRKDGYGYGKIAELLNISKSQVSSFCRGNKIDISTESKTSYCIFCGLPIVSQPHHKQRKFCSDK